MIRLRQRRPAMTGFVPFGAQPTPQRIGIVARVGNKAAQPPRHSGEHVRRGRHVTGVAGREMDNRGAADDVGENVDFRRLTAARRTDSLCLAPLFAVCRAVRTDVGAVERPVPAIHPASANAASMARRKPRRDQRLNRL